ncbi:MAG: PilZ domain-containing protein [Novosphingobium sp.]
MTGRRAVPRARLFLPANVMLLQGLEKCLLEDLSQHGARIWLGTCIPRTSSGAVLQVNDLDVFGTVVWIEGQRFGLQFDEVVPLRQVVLIRHYADAYAEHEAILSARNARNFVQGRPRLNPMR